VLLPERIHVPASALVRAIVALLLMIAPLISLAPVLEPPSVSVRVAIAVVSEVLKFVAVNTKALEPLFVIDPPPLLPAAVPLPIWKVRLLVFPLPV